MSDDDVFPDRNMSHREKVEFMLEREGWAIDTVAPRTEVDPPLPRLTYTVGVPDRFGFPDLCVVGLSPVASRGLFDLVLGAVAGGTDLPVGAPFEGLLDGGQPCALVEVAPAVARDLFPALAEHHRLTRPHDELPAVLQLVWPDGGGRLPWEPGFADELVTVQLVLGDPPTGG